jgi:hypothetical protein
MLRGKYLQLRAEQQDLALGVTRWDTRSLAELKGTQTALANRLARDEALLTASHIAQGRIEAERQSQVECSRRLLLYLRALCYLREHGIAPDWPRGSAPAVLEARSGSTGLP